MDVLPRHIGSFYWDPHLSHADPALTCIEALGSRAGAAWPLSAVPSKLDPAAIARAAGLDFFVTAVPVAAVLPGAATDLFGSVDPTPTLLPAPRHRALVRDSGTDTAQMVGIVSTSYPIVQNKRLVETGLLLARAYSAEPRPLAAAAVGRPRGSWVFVAVTLASLAEDLVAVLLLSNSHSGEESVKVRVVPVHEPSATLLCPGGPRLQRVERHQGDVDGRLSRLTTAVGRQQWIDEGLTRLVDGRCVLERERCTPEECAELVDHLWPSSEQEIWVPGNLLLQHPRAYFHGSTAEHSRWETYVKICQFIDHGSEAREKDDWTKERDERLVRGAGDAIKQTAWTWLMDRCRSTGHSRH